MDNVKRLTGIKETATGFVGSNPIHRGKTKNGRSLIMFTIACGIDNIHNGQYATWRQCIVYGDSADNLKDIVTGSYVEVTGFIITSVVKDKYGNIKKDSLGNDLREEKIISENAVHINSDSQCRQLPLVTDSPAVVGRE